VFCFDQHPFGCAKFSEMTDSRRSTPQPGTFFQLVDAEWTVVCYPAGVMRNSAESEPIEPSASRMQLRSAYLIRTLSDNRTQRFILEEVATRKRRQFDDLQSLLVHLQDVLTIGPA
jgi:hypothetical protein